MRKCPFCDMEIRTDFPYLTFLPSKGQWNLSHTCPHPDDELGVWIDVYGKTAQECLDKWNGVWHEDEESESL